MAEVPISLDADLPEGAVGDLRISVGLIQDPFDWIGSALGSGAASAEAVVEVTPGG
jgi:hypothetical protein